MRGVERSETALNLAEFDATRKPRAMPSDIPDSVVLRLAREQRAAGVQAETILWRMLRDRRCEGANFAGKFRSAISLSLSFASRGD